MEKSKKSLKTKIILIAILGTIICASIFVSLNFKKWIAGPRADVEISVTDLFFKPSRCGDGRTLYINLTIKNNRNSTNSWICLPYVITDKGKKHECMFDSPIEIPPYGVVNVTAHTYDSESVCTYLSMDEIPKKFGYRVDIGDILPPLAFEINIPKDLIAKVSIPEDLTGKGNLIIFTDDSCKVRIPSTIMLQSLSRYNTEVMDSDYKWIIIPKELCIASYPPDIDGYYIVQYDGPIRDEQKKQVQNLGAKEYGYIQEYSFIYKMDNLTKEKIKSLPFVEWIGIYQPAYKIAPSVNISQGGEVIVNVLIFDVNPEEIVSKIKDLGGMASSSGSDIVKVRIDASKIPEIARINNVMWIEQWVMPKISH